MLLAALLVSFEASPAAFSAQKEAVSPAQQKIASDLLDAIRRDRGEPSVSPRPVPVELDKKCRALLDVRAEVTDSLLAQIRALGGKVINQFPEHQAIRVRLALKDIETLAERSEVASIRLADKATTKLWTLRRVQERRG